MSASEETALAMKAASGPRAAISTPPSAGPMARAMLNAMALSVTAAASSSAPTISRTAVCQAGPFSAVPMPSAKVRSSRPAGSRWPSIRSTASQIETSAIHSWAMISTRRRSRMSATAPATSAKISTGAWVAVWTSATMSGVPASEVMSQAAPTPWISVPRLETRLAVHTMR